VMTSENDQTDGVAEFCRSTINEAMKTTAMLKRTMTRPSALLCFVLPTAAMALVPHQFWNGPKATTATSRDKLSPQRRAPIGATVSMYFDDCERSNEIEERLKKSFLNSNVHPRENTDNKDNPWIISQSEEKRQALEKFLGYNPKSASTLTEEEIEEETLRWVVNTDIIWTGDDNDKDGDGESSSDSNLHEMVEGIDQQRITHVQYDGINDLLVASSCDSTAQSLAFLWERIAEVLEAEAEASATQKASASRNSAKLVVFPNSKSLWSYDTMVTMLEAVQISRPLLPSNLELGLDLFHPNFKHSPRMWSPQWHSPFPTVGITVRAKKQTSVDEITDLDTIRGKLDVLFQAMDATPEHARTSDQDRLQLLEDCQSWWDAENNPADPNRADNQTTDWTVQSLGSPFQLYRTLWNSVFDLSNGGKSASVVIDPVLDYYTLHRVAVTVNAALKRLDIPVRITEVYHPFARSASSNSQTRPPHGMIRLTPVE